MAAGLYRAGGNNHKVVFAVCSHYVTPCELSSVAEIERSCACSAWSFGSLNFADYPLARFYYELKGDAVSIRIMFSSIVRLAGLGLALALLSALLGALGAPDAQAATPRAPQQAAPAAIDSGLVGYWPFDFGNAATDLSGSGNTATFGDGMGLTSTTAPTRFANIAALLSQPTSTSYATAPGNNIDNLQQFTIAFWLRPSSLPGSGCMSNGENATRPFDRAIAASYRAS
jgi:hypothetical protein